MLRQLLPRSSCSKLSPKLAAAFAYQRAYSQAVQLREIEPSALTIEKTSAPKALIPPKELVFGKTFTGAAKADVQISAHTNLC